VDPLPDPSARSRTLALTFGLALVIGGSPTPAWAGPAASPANADEAPFVAENEAAMSRMMTDMAVKPTGDVDRDFVAMMAPHHQGAIDMAGVYLRYGHNEQLRRLAQEIIVTQQQEIAVMRQAVGLPLPPPAPAPTQLAPASEATSPAKTMSPDMKMSPDMNMHQEPK
jgi:Domain of unknown function (DUF305)